MRILLLVLGTRGDFELFLTLAQELESRGHHVRLASSGFYADRVHEAGLAWLPIGEGGQEDLVDLLRGLASLSDPRARVEAYFRNWVQPELGRSMGALRAALQETDYLINNLKTVWTREKRLIPGAHVTYEPPGAIENLGKHLPRKLRDTGAFLEVVALSKPLVDPDDAWGERFHFTGFWEPPCRQAAPADELRAFLDEGEPPVALTMGSMVMFDGGRVLGAFLEALRRAGRRGLIVGGWSEIADRGELPASVAAVAEAPYEWLFPRVASVVHHGGCGTVGATLRAGVPSILLPLIPSQEHFADILVRERLAVDRLDVEALDPLRLASAIQRSTGDRGYAEVAGRWRDRVGRDPGCTAAGDLIDRHGAQLAGTAA